jgi:predicted O-methyltransferase YrrM
MSAKQTIVNPPVTDRGARFLDELRARVGDIDSPAALPTYVELKASLKCQSSPPKLALLDAAGATLQPGEHYLEIGSFTGASLIAAARDNPDGRFTGVDNFSQFDGSYDLLNANLAEYGVAERVDFIIGDCWEVLGRPDLEPVSVYLFDGPHEYEDQYRALEQAERHLVPGALIIVDDTRWHHVSLANRHFVESHPGWRLLCDLPSAFNGDDVWWNGLQVFEFVAPAAPIPPSPVASLARGGHALLKIMRQKERYHEARRFVKKNPTIRRARRIPRRLLGRR